MRGVLLLVCLCAWAQDRPALEEFRSRRAALLKALPDGVVVLFGRGERAEGAGRSGFWQEPNFYYLSGWQEPGAALLLAPGSEILFLPKPDARTLIYDGPRLSAEDPNAAEITGFQTVSPRARLESELLRALDQHPRIYTLVTQPEAEKLRSLAPLRPLADARTAVARLRIKKSPRELEQIQRSIDVTIEAQRAAWKRIAPGLYEHQIAATVVGTFLERGCEDAAFAPIVASGPNAIILHYVKNQRRMEPGELLLMDVGASCGGYAADLTRTVPVSGRFTPRQRELYEVVLGALKAALSAVRPGVLLGTRDNFTGLYKVARDYIDSHGKDLEGRPLGDRLLHPIAHRVGLNVHDVHTETVNLPLEPGDVITLEPGVYIKEEGIGIRIEDMVLVTETGARLLSGALPREAAEIEKEMSRAGGAGASR